MKTETSETETSEIHIGSAIRRPLRNFPLLVPRDRGPDMSNFQTSRVDNPERDGFMAKLKKRRTMDDILKDHARLVMEMDRVDFDET